MKLIALTILTALMYSCKNSDNTDKISLSINDYMQKNVDDPSNYEPVETILTDSSMVHTLTYDAKKIFFKNGERDMDFITYAENLALVKDSLKKAGHDTIKKVVGYYFYKHKYRIKKHGEKSLETMYFIFDDKKDQLFMTSPKEKAEFKDESMY